MVVERDHSGSVTETERKNIKNGAVVIFETEDYYCPEDYKLDSLKF